MAYLIGLVKPAELATLRARGWEAEPVSEASLAEITATVERTNGTDDSVVMVFVDSSLLEVMSGPNWEQGNG
jgi:hypothetical protein